MKALQSSCLSTCKEMAPLLSVAVLSAHRQAADVTSHAAGKAVLQHHAKDLAAEQCYPS
jgi:hypothetical protein